MKNKKTLNMGMGIIALILGSALIKQFDFETLKFKHNGLALIYLTTFAFSIYFLIKGYKSQPKNN